MWKLLFGLIPTRVILPEPETTANDHRYAAGLQLERRLYESAIAAVDQTFAKEGLVAAFLTSGAIVAFASSLGAFAQVAALVGQRATWIVVGMLSLSLALLVCSIIKFASVLRGWKVQDISDALQFLNGEPVPVSKDEVILKQIAVYKQARENHEQLVKDRLKNLIGAMWWLGSATVTSFLAILGAFLSVAIHKAPLIPTAMTQTIELPAKSLRNIQIKAYNIDMSQKPTSSKPAPVVLPKPGAGTTMIKGGGGNGTRK